MRGGGFGGSSGPPERSQQSGSWSVRAGSPGGEVPGGPEGPERLLKTRGRVCGKETGGLSVQARFRTFKNMLENNKQ